MPPLQGLPGLDTSLHFSPAPLHHLFLVFPGGGDPYTDHQPWLSSLEKCLTRLQTNYNALLSDLSSTTTSAKTALFLPVEYHRSALHTWTSNVSKGDPRPNTTGVTTVREAVSDSLFPIVMMASPFWKRNLAVLCAQQIVAQIDAVRRNRPAFSGRVSFLTHSIGCVVALEVLRRRQELLPDDIELDAVIMTGCPLPAYAALAPDEQMALATIQQLRQTIRFINVFHPLDPVAYRLEPFVFCHSEQNQNQKREGEGALEQEEIQGQEKEQDLIAPAVKVHPRRRTFWQDAELFWDDVVYNLWSSLFPRRTDDNDNDNENENENENGEQDGTSTTTTSPSADPQGYALQQQYNGITPTPTPPTDPELIGNLFSAFGGNTRGVQSVATRNRRRRYMRRSSSYVLPDADQQDGESDSSGPRNRNRDRGVSGGGGEVLLSGRIDYELQDGMGMPPIDLMASWGAIKAHSYYWQSLDVAQMLLDVAMTSETAMSSRSN